jgi:hypothetical protein
MAIFNSYVKLPEGNWDFCQTIVGVKEKVQTVNIAVGYEWHVLRG